MIENESHTSIVIDTTIPNMFVVINSILLE